jgi:cell division protein FtsB
MSCEDVMNAAELRLLVAELRATIAEQEAENADLERHNRELREAVDALLQPDRSEPRESTA